MPIRILKVAQIEFSDAKDYYEIEQTGLGKYFESEIKEGINRTIQNPEAWPIELPEIRRHILHKFPYKILYSIQEEEIIILAFAHFHRKPDYWEERMKDI